MKYVHVPFKKLFNRYPNTIGATVVSILLAPMFGFCIFVNPTSIINGVLVGYYIGWVVWGHMSDRWRNEARESLALCDSAFRLLEVALPDLKKKVVSKESGDGKTSVQ